MRNETEQVNFQADEFLFAVKEMEKRINIFWLENVMNKQYLIIY